MTGLWLLPSPVPAIPGPARQGGRGHTGSSSCFQPHHQPRQQHPSPWWQFHLGERVPINPPAHSSSSQPRSQHADSPSWGEGRTQHIPTQSQKAGITQGVCVTQAAPSLSRHRLLPQLQMSFARHGRLPGKTHWASTQLLTRCGSHVSVNFQA